MNAIRRNVLRMNAIRNGKLYDGAERRNEI